MVRFWWIRKIPKTRAPGDGSWILSPMSRKYPECARPFLGLPLFAPVLFVRKRLMHCLVLCEPSPGQQPHNHLTNSAIPSRRSSTTLKPGVAYGFRKQHAWSRTW